MVTCFSVLAGFLWWARQSLPGLSPVWWGLCIFFATRAFQSVPRALRQIGVIGDGSRSQLATDTV
jgi:hypothetical protein